MVLHDQHSGCMQSEQVSEPVKRPLALFHRSPAEWSSPTLCTFCRPGAYTSVAWSDGWLTCCSLSLTASSLITQVECSFTPAGGIQRDSIQQERLCL